MKRTQLAALAGITLNENSRDGASTCLTVDLDTGRCSLLDPNDIESEIDGLEPIHGTDGIVSYLNSEARVLTVCL